MVARGVKFGVVVIVCQIIFLLLFAFLAKYDVTAQPKDPNPASPIPKFYPMFQDIQVMLFLGIGYLLAFSRFYGYSAVGFNLLIGCFCVQMAMLVRGFIYFDITGGQRFPVDITVILSAEFAAATVMISFGAVLGKTSPLQLLVMAGLEIILAQLNEYLGFHIFYTADVGESMFIHVFAAYFGLAVARVLHTEDIADSHKEGSIYHSDLFSLIGTVFLWLYWPSFNGGAASGDEQHRAIINTYLSLVACAFMTFALCALLDKNGRFDVVVVQNATLAGGVVTGATADMPLEPWGAMLLGSLAAVLSVLGFKYLSPALTRHMKLHDACGIHNLHGLPGLLAAIAAAIMAALADIESWGQSLCEIFPARAGLNSSTPCDGTLELTRTAVEQGGYQMAALAVTLVVSIVGGTLTGLVLKLPIWDTPKGDQLFDDQPFWAVADYTLPDFVLNKQRAAIDRNADKDDSTPIPKSLLQKFEGGS